MNFCVKRLVFHTELDDFRCPFRTKTQTLFHICYVSFEHRTQFQTGVRDDDTLTSATLRTGSRLRTARVSGEARLLPQDRFARAADSLFAAHARDPKVSLLPGFTSAFPFRPAYTSGPHTLMQVVNGVSIHSEQGTKSSHPAKSTLK